MTARYNLLSRYGLVSGICFATNWATLVASERAGLPYGLGVLLSYGLCVLIGYTLHTAYTYERQPHRRGILHYAFAMAMNLPTASATIWLFYGQAHLPMAFAAPLSSVVGFGLNFLSTRWAILGRPVFFTGKAG